VANPRLVVTRHDSEFAREVQSALDSLRALGSNWDGYGALRIDPEVIDAAKMLVATLPDRRASGARVVPMSNGTLQLEWHQGSKSLELEFESPSSIRYLQWHPEQQIEEEDSFPIANGEKPLRLIRWFTAGARE
jgi:hypothetical protein